jgi:hypothetical protein
MFSAAFYRRLCCPPIRPVATEKHAHAEHSSSSRSIYSVSRTSFINSVYNCWKWQFYLHPSRIRLLFAEMSFFFLARIAFWNLQYIFPSLFFFIWSARCQMARYVYVYIYIYIYIYIGPITVAARLKAWTVFARSTLGSWLRIPLKAWMSLCVYSVCVVLCVGSGLATGWSPVQEVLPTIYRRGNWKSGQGPQGL